MAAISCAYVLMVLGTAVSALSGLAPIPISLMNNTTSTPTLFPIRISFRPKPPVITNAYLVKLKSSSGLAVRSSNAHDEFHKRAIASIDYTTRHEYTDEALFVGLSLTLHDDGDLQTLKDLEDVEKVWPVYSVERPMAVAKPRIPRNNGSNHVRDNVVKATQSNVTLPYITGDTKPGSALKMANVDKLHASGTMGAGVNIAAIDTGVDCRHPSLGGCFGPGCKVSFGYNLVGDDYPETTVPSPDPLTTCVDGGHGTHVMGIIGMEDPASVGFGLLGVAPEASLGMYRVFGCDGGTGTDVILAAMLMAAADGAHVISMSLGYMEADEADDPFRVVTAALNEQGVAVIVAAGNDGDLGIFSPSAPAIGTTVLAVGSVDNNNFPVTYQLTDTRGRHFRYASVFPVDADPAGLSFIILADGEITDFSICFEDYYYDAYLKLVDPETTVLAIQTGGGCTSTAKAQAAEYYGFKYVMFYSTADEIPDLLEYHALEPLGDGFITLWITADNALSIINEAEKNPDYRIFLTGVSATDYVAQSPTQITGGFMSNYSSFGPTTELDMKPQVSAPGGNILSTWPLEGGGYSILSGTSMATPFMAGCYALVKSQLPDLTVNELFALLMNTATPLSWYYDKLILASAVQQGTGLVNPHAALGYESLVTPQQLNVGATDTPVKKTIIIKNRTTRSKTYVLTHKAAGLMEENFVPALLTQMYPSYATATFSTTSILIQAGASAIVDVTITPPIFNANMQPVYSGFIIVTNNNDVFTVPYVGQPFDPATVNLIADIAPYRLKYPDANGSYIRLLPVPNIFAETQFLTTPSYPDPDRQNFAMAGLSYPGIVFGTTQVVDYLRFDVVASNTSFIPKKYGFDPTVTFNDTVYPSGPITTIVGLDTFATAIDYGYGPWSETPVAVFKWLDKTLPAADYRLVMRALRSGGDYDDPQAWDSWLSAIVRIAR